MKPTNFRTFIPSILLSVTLLLHIVSWRYCMLTHMYVICVCKSRCCYSPALLFNNIHNQYSWNTASNGIPWISIQFPWMKCACSWTIGWCMNVLWMCVYTVVVHHFIILTDRLKRKVKNHPEKIIYKCEQIAWSRNDIFSLVIVISGYSYFTHLLYSVLDIQSQTINEKSRGFFLSILYACLAAPLLAHLPGVLVWCVRCYIFLVCRYLSWIILNYNYQFINSQ